MTTLDDLKLPPFTTVQQKHYDEQRAATLRSVTAWNAKFKKNNKAALLKEFFARPRHMQFGWMLDDINSQG